MSEDLVIIWRVGWILKIKVFEIKKMLGVDIGYIILCCVFIRFIVLCGIDISLLMELWDLWEY